MSGLFSATGPASAAGGIASGTTPGASTAVAALVNPPPALSQLAVGSLITGLVTGRDARNILQIKTDQGTVGLSTRLPLETGHRVTLQLQVAGARMQVILLAIDGRPVGTAHAGPPGATPATQPAPGAATPATGSQAATTPTGATPADGTASGGAAGPSAANPLAPGRALIGWLAPQSGTPAGTDAAPVATRRLSLRVVSLGMPRSGLALPRPTLMAAHSPGDVATMSATATGAEANGNPIVKTPLGMVTLAAKARLPVGAILLVELLDSELPPEAALHAGDRQRVPGSLSRDWPALREAIGVLAPLGSGPATAAADRALPQPGPRLLLDLLAYVAGLRNGKPPPGLGTGMASALAQAGRPELAAQLAEEFGQMARLAADQPAGEWRAFLIPLYHEERLHQIRMFLRRDRQGADDAEAGDGQTRFVVEVALSAFGEVQIDGLSRRKRLDLILRSHARMPDGMRRDLTEIYTRCCQATGIAGEIAFQTAPAFAVTPLEDIAERDPGLVV